MGLLEKLESQKRQISGDQPDVPVKAPDMFLGLKEMVQNTIIEEINKQANPNIG